MGPIGITFLKEEAMSDAPTHELQVSPPEFGVYMEAMQKIKEGEQAKAMLARQILGTRGIELEDGAMFRFDFTIREAEEDPKVKHGWLEVYRVEEPPSESEPVEEEEEALPPPPLPEVRDAPAPAKPIVRMPPRS
jgi:hypothetical protein